MSAAALRKHLSAPKPAAHSVRSSKSSPARVPCVPLPSAGNKRARLRREDEVEGEKGRAGEKKKREKNAGYARLIFRASEECAEAPLVSPFSVSVPMKRDGEAVGLRGGVAII